MLKLLIGYAVFTAIWFAGLAVYLFYQKNIAPLTAKISKAPVQLRQEITRNFGYGFTFSGGMSFFIAAIVGLVNGDYLIWKILLLVILAIYLVIIGLKLIARSIQEEKMEGLFMIGLAFIFFTGLYWLIQKIIPTEEEKSLLKEQYLFVNHKPTL